MASRSTRHDPRSITITGQTKLTKTNCNTNRSTNESTKNCIEFAATVRHRWSLHKCIFFFTKAEFITDSRQWSAALSTPASTSSSSSLREDFRVIFPAFQNLSLDALERKH